MAFLFDSGRGRMDIDNVVRQSDRTLNVLVVVFIAAFALIFGACRFGQLSQLPSSAPPTAAAPEAAPAPKL